MPWRLNPVDAPSQRPEYQEKNIEPGILSRWEVSGLLTSQIAISTFDGIN